MYSMIPGKKKKKKKNNINKENNAISDDIIDNIYVKDKKRSKNKKKKEKVDDEKYNPELKVIPTVQIEDNIHSLVPHGIGQAFAWKEAEKRAEIYFKDEEIARQMQDEYPNVNDEEKEIVQKLNDLGLTDEEYSQAVLLEFRLQEEKMEKNQEQPYSEEEFDIALQMQQLSIFDNKDFVENNSYDDNKYDNSIIKEEDYIRVPVKHDQNNNIMKDRSEFQTDFEYSQYLQDYFNNNE
eukprot:TRINITY_DN958_c0_g1_i1.p1 TRINITY_DN958_c0_g1~~TRINITY_DN958_c0_g1_i1.p1  ORF type:complete len:244 (-),score=95.80 TRINITY_DN958_c0_g1_i1:196-906(-)